MDQLAPHHTCLLMTLELVEEYCKSCSAEKSLKNEMKSAVYREEVYFVNVGICRCGEGSDVVYVQSSAWTQYCFPCFLEQLKGG